MPTPAERKALLFFAAVLVLGAGVRAARALRGAPAPDAGSRRALAAQLARVDSARRAPAKPKAARRVARRKTQRARSDTLSDAPSAARPLDLDVAGAAEIERLPGVGAVLARRIVASRDSCGAFGSLEGLRRVRGVGPALTKRMAGLVTFSGAPRPIFGSPGPCGEAEKGRRPKPARRLP